MKSLLYTATSWTGAGYVTYYYAPLDYFEGAGMVIGFYIIIKASLYLLTIAMLFVLSVIEVLFPMRSFRRFLRIGEFKND